MGNMEHWNQFLQSVLSDTYKDARYRKNIKKSKDEEAGSTNKLTSKKGAKNE